MSSGCGDLQAPASLCSVSVGSARSLGCSLPIGRSAPVGTIKLALAVAGVLTIAVGVVALLVHLALAARARQWLAFLFTGIPAEPSVAAGIFLRNLRALAAVGGLLLIAQSRSWVPGGAGAAHRALQRIGEVLLAAMVAANVIVVGASLGAYGARMIRASLPHGPVELAAYSLALAVYLEGRRRPLAGRHVAAGLALPVFLLVVAAVLETFVSV